VGPWIDPALDLAAARRRGMGFGGLADEVLEETPHPLGGIDAALEIGTGALVEYRLDLREFLHTVELACYGRGQIEHRQAERPRGGRLAAAVEQNRIEPVACGLEACLGQRLASRDPLLVAVGLDPGQALHQGSDRANPAQVELGVGGADLDRAESRVDSCVPPNVCVILEVPGSADLASDARQ
jgi:hypothetical protein